MSETRVNWHKYPEEPIPKRFKKVLVTEKKSLLYWCTYIICWLFII